ncbi:MAG: T9SS C-terminal target domain-containing protein [Bacteroidetes bacterium]|nr:MAG: T9SS C-terminal target domain-containing protein [Bacteroidota bacterium]
MLIMTKPFLIVFAAILLGFSGLYGQEACVGNTMLPDSIIVSPRPYQDEFPERGIQDTACVGLPFETVFTINLPATFALSGVELPIDSARVGEQGIINLPASMSYDCNPPNCVFYPDTVGCIRIFGTPTAAEVGRYDLGIDVSVATAFPYNAVLPDGILVTGNYYLFVQEAGSPYCLASSTDEPAEGGFDLVVQPNPIRDYAEIFVRLPQPDSYTLSVYDARGVQVRQEQMQLPAGEQYLHFDATQLPVGMYVFTLQGTTEAASGRILVQR